MILIKKTISKDLPLAELTLRRYEKPYASSKRDAIRKLCLSVGLLQPGDSRDVIIDVLQVLLASKQQKKWLSSIEVSSNVIRLRKQQKLPLKGIADSNIRRQLKRLRDLFFIEKTNNMYRITEFEELDKIFEDKIEKIYLPNILNRVKDYIKLVK